MWYASGPHLPTGGDLDQNGRPDFVDSAGRYAEETWKTLDSLGYRHPKGLSVGLATGAAIPSGKYSIEIVDLGVWDSLYYYKSATMGVTSDSSSNPFASSHVGSWIVLDNDFLYNGKKDSVRVRYGGKTIHNYATQWNLGLQVALAHELYHAFSYEYESQDLYAFHEMTATWFESWRRPAIHNRWRYLTRFRDYLDDGVFSTFNKQSNGNSYFIQYLADRKGFDVVRKLWEYRAKYRPRDDESKWFSMAWDTLQLGTRRDFMQGYLTQVGSWLVGLPSEFDDQGLVRGAITRSFLSRKIADTTENSGIPLSSSSWGIDGVILSKDSLPNMRSVNLLSIDRTPKYSLVIIHLPSLQIQSLNPETRYSRGLGFWGSDTALLFLMMEGYEGSGCGILGSQGPVGISERARRRPASISPPIRVDLLGRRRGPVNSATEIFFEGSQEGSWGKRVEIGE